MTSPLLINESPLQVLPSLAVKIGLNEAIILQQIHYWLNPKFNQNFFQDRYWVYNTYEQWQTQFPFWGEKTIRRAIGSLESLGLLITFMKNGFEKKKYYTIDYDCLSSLSDSEKMAETLYVHSSGQNDQIDLPKRADREGQDDQLDQVRMTRSYNKDTETTQETTLHPPLTPPSVIVEEEKEEEDFCQEMISLWNSHVQSQLKLEAISYLSPSRKANLAQIFRQVFKNDIALWEKYCQQIASCRFLMGYNLSGFRISLDWALDLANVGKVLEGAYYDKAPPMTSSTSGESIIDLTELAQGISCESIPGFGKDLSKALIKRFGQHTYASWFRKFRVARLTNKEVVFEVESLFARDYIVAHFHEVILEVVKTICPSLVDVDYQIIPEEKGLT